MKKISGRKPRPSRSRTALAGPCQLDADGYFVAATGERIVPLGANYWPGSCGVDMWQAWPAEEIQRDLDLVHELGLNCVRWFLRWQDFEPRAGQYNATAFKRLEALLEWHRERGLWAHPSLFVGWMSGGTFWPEWKSDRNVFGDSMLRRRAVRFTEKVAALCAQYADVILAIDQGNELCCLADSVAARPADVISWCEDVSAAVKRAFPRALVISGNEQNQVTYDTGWRFGEQRGCALYSMHTYPVSTWHSLAFDGMSDPLGQSLLPFYVKCARAWGPVFVQEFGTLLTRGETECGRYLRAILPACWRAGANGFLWWCLKDISATIHPYNKNAFEGLLGLVDASGKVKPSLRPFLDFVREISAGSPPDRKPAEICLYWPREYYDRDNPLNPGNEPRELSRRLAVAHFALTELGYSVDIVRQFSAAPSTATVVIAGAKLTAREIEELGTWVENGGRAVFHAPDALTWGVGMERVLGAEPLDFGAGVPTRLSAFGARWELKRFPRDILLRVRLRTAKPVAAAAQSPVIFRHELGAGCVVTCLADIDGQFAAQSIDLPARNQWTRWYAGMLSACGRRGTATPRKRR